MPSGRPVDTLFLELRAQGTKLVADVNRALADVDKRIISHGKRITNLGKQLSLKLSAPATAVSGGLLKVGGDFEEAMNRVNANAQASVEEFEALRKVARDIGSDTTLPGMAIDAANAMDILARNGLKAAQLMDRQVTVSMIRLAKATGGDYGQSADIATDALAQFNMELSDLGKVADQIVGVTLNSKFAIDDYMLAIAQGGGVAASSGVSFEDFNATLAATAFLFKSGSDAGTSFKTFLMRLQNPTDDARGLMKQLNLEFFDAQGNLKDMADIAAELDRAFSNMSEEKRGQAFAEMFGSDAARTAVGLMKAGREEIERLKKAVSGGSVEDNLTKRLQGYNGALQRLKKTLNSLALDFADSGLLEAGTRRIELIIKSINDLNKRLSPEMKKFIGQFALAAAFIGPIVIGLGLFITMVGKVVAAVGVLGAALVGAFALGAVDWEKFKASIQNSNIGPMLSQIAEKIREFGIPLPTLDQIGSVFNMIATKVAAVRDKFEEWFGEVPWAKIGLIAGSILALQIAFGPLVMLVQTLITSFTALASGVLAFGARLVPVGAMVSRFAHPIGIAITAITLLVYALQNNDTLMSIWKTTLNEAWKALQDLWAAVQRLIRVLDEALEPIGGIEGLLKGLAIVIGGALTIAITALIKGFTIVIETITLAINVIVSVMETAKKLGDGLLDLSKRGLEAVIALFNGVKDFLGNKLGAVLDGVGGKITGLTNKFKWMYEAVVGGSYVPDMVDGLIDENKRLENGFFQPMERDITELTTVYDEFAGQTLESLSKKLEELREKFDVTPIGTKEFEDLKNKIGGIERAMQTASTQMDDFHTNVQSKRFENPFWEQMRVGLNGAIGAMIDGTKSAKDVFRDFAADFLANIAKMIAEQLVFNSIAAAAGTSGGGTVGNFVGALLGYASGGRPHTSQPSLVGERGPEIWWPDTAGSIIPMSKMRGLGGGGVKIALSQTFTGGVTEKDLARQLVRTREEAKNGVVQGVRQAGIYRRQMQS